MNISRRRSGFTLRGTIKGGAFCAAVILAVSGCNVYVSSGPAPQPAPVTYDQGNFQYQPPPADVFTVYHDDLDPYGHWVNVAPYGACWVPNNESSDWTPYTVGHWVNTDDGWMWVADGDEADWGGVVYHYGCWYSDPGNGWVWVPGTTWAPAWVGWREGGGYCGWAPLPPQVAFGGNISGGEVDRYVPANRYVFVNEQYMTGSRVDQHIVRNDTTIINQTKNITQITNENGHVVNRGVAVANVERATGHAVETVAVVKATTPQEARSMAASGKAVQYSPPVVEKARQEGAANEAARKGPGETNSPAMNKPLPAPAQEQAGHQGNVRSETGQEQPPRAEQPAAGQPVEQPRAEHPEQPAGQPQEPTPTEHQAQPGEQNKEEPAKQPEEPNKVQPTKQPADQSKEQPKAAPKEQPDKAKEQPNDQNGQKDQDQKDQDKGGGGS